MMTTKSSVRVADQNLSINRSAVAATAEEPLRIIRTMREEISEERLSNLRSVEILECVISSGDVAYISKYFDGDYREVSEALSENRRIIFSLFPDFEQEFPQTFDNFNAIVMACDELIQRLYLNKIETDTSDVDEQNSAIISKISDKLAAAARRGVPLATIQAQVEAALTRAEELHALSRQGSTLASDLTLCENIVETVVSKRKPRKNAANYSPDEIREARRIISWQSRHRDTPLEKDELRKAYRIATWADRETRRRKATFSSGEPPLPSKERT